MTMRDMQSVCFVCGSSGQDCSWLLGPRNSPSRQMTDWWLYIVVITSELVILLPTDWPASSVTINRNRKTSSISQPAAAGPGRVSRLTTQEIGASVFATDKISSTSDIVKMILRNFKFSVTRDLTLLEELGRGLCVVWWVIPLLYTDTAVHIKCKS